MIDVTHLLPMHRDTSDLTDLHLLILGALWAAGESTIAQIHASIGERHDVSGKTIGTLGALTIFEMTVVGDGSTQVLEKTEKEGEAQIILDMDAAPPYRITRLGLQVGG